MFKSEQEIEEESRRIKKQTFIGILIIFSVFFLIIIYWVYLHPTTLVESTSSSGEKEVIIKGHGNGLLGGGFITVILKKDGKTMKRKVVKVDNATQSNHRERYTISWLYNEENIVRVTMNFQNSNKTLTYNYGTLDLEIETSRAN